MVQQKVFPPEVPFNGITDTEPDNPQQPFELFKSFISDDMLTNLCYQTNVYSVEKPGVSINTSVAELEKIIGMYFQMGIVQLPSVRSYWERATRYPPIADSMSRNRFEQLVTRLHLINNHADNINRDDKLWKLNPWLHPLRDNFLKIQAEEHQAIDEIMVAFEGKQNPRVYMPKKPTKWGYKIWGRAGSSGFLYDFDVYQGEAKSPTAKNEVGVGGETVLKLVSTLPTHQNFKMYGDNYFTSIALLSKLSDLGMQYLGTIRDNRLRKCPLKTDKAMKKEGRGSMDAKVEEHSNIVVVKWFDNKAVTLISNYVGAEPIGVASRWDKKQNAYVEFSRPAAVAEYNKFMGGIDLMDMLSSLYKYHIKSRRWYLYIWWHSPTIAMVNAWLLYRRQRPGEQVMKLRQFQVEVAECLLSVGKVKSKGRLSGASPPIQRKRNAEAAGIDVRLDGVGHLPSWLNVRQRCKCCSDNRSFVYCEKCNVYLCLNKDRNCY